MPPRIEGAAARLVEHVLVARFLGLGSATAAGAYAPHVFLEFLLRLAYVALVLDDRVERLVDQRAVEILNVEQRQRLDPVERLADTRRLLEVELAQRLHHR